MHLNRVQLCNVAVCGLIELLLANYRNILVYIITLTKQLTNMRKILIAAMLLLLAISSCKKSDTSSIPSSYTWTASENVLNLPSTAVVMDIDGNIYHEIKIGNQTWLQENLKVTHYQDGSPIKLMKDSLYWGTLTKGAYCDYYNQPDNCNNFGHLYNYFAVTNKRGLAPKGWHIPSNDEVDTLVTYLGGEFVAGDKMKGIQYWENFGDTTVFNSSGFTGLPAGDRSPDGDFSDMGQIGIWWTSTLYLPNDNTAYFFMVTSFDGSVINHDDLLTWGWSVRCIKD